MHLAEYARRSGHAEYARRAVRLEGQKPPTNITSLVRAYLEREGIAAYGRG